MTYPRFHRILLVVVLSLVVIAAITVLAIVGVLLQVSAALVAIALFWIAWELRRMFSFLQEIVEEYAQAFLDGYQEALVARQEQLGDRITE